jgi:hypothetical protein
MSTRQYARRPGAPRWHKQKADLDIEGLPVTTLETGAGVCRRMTNLGVNLGSSDCAREDGDHHRGHRRHGIPEAERRQPPVLQAATDAARQTSKVQGARCGGGENGANFDGGRFGLLQQDARRSGNPRGVEPKPHSCSSHAKGGECAPCWLPPLTREGAPSVGTFRFAGAT